jgi:hypothetical protein
MSKELEAIIGVAVIALLTLAVVIAYVLLR